MQFISDPGIKIPSGDQASVPARIAFLNGLQLKGRRWHDGYSHSLSLCTSCGWPCATISGPISAATITLNTSRILTRAGFSVFNRTGVCEKCATELEQGRDQTH